ncbi:MAG: hypothetical protein EAY66_01310 [Sphingobacteriales bacterium]|nr:MAG: hypothetical protein EAY66_01310 [Sphingobacteriales bacterium]
MKPLKNILVLLCSLLLLSASCKKPSKNPIDNLPPATQTGANTFGCLVNGEVFLPKGSGFGGPVLRCQYVFDNGFYTLYLSASNRAQDINKSIRLVIKDIDLSPNLYVLNNDSTSKGEYSTINNLLFTNSYKTTLNNTGNLRINYWNPGKGVLSGNFSFDAVNSIGEKVEIREGRFDVKL